MNFEHLKIFVSVVDSGGFTKAAEALYISHSTTSRAVSALEDSLGVRLLDRNSRSFSLTAAGRLVYEEGARLLRAAVELERQAAEAGDGAEGSLRAAVVPMGGPVLDRAFELFRVRNPDISPVIIQRGISEVKAMVSGGEADLGVGFSYALGDMEGFEQRNLARSRFCALARQDHPLAKGRALSLEELRSEDYITLGSRRSAFARALEAPILEDRPAGEIINVETLESLFLQIRSGRGISLVPEPMALRMGEGCSVLETELPSEFEIVLFWPETGGSPLAPLFAEAVSNPGES